MKKQLYVIVRKDRQDYIRKTGIGNTWVYSDRLGASRFIKKDATSLLKILDGQNEHELQKL